jgi:hypothetical protein
MTAILGTICCQNVHVGFTSPARARVANPRCVYLNHHTMVEASGGRVVPQWSTEWSTLGVDFPILHDQSAKR